MTGNSDGVGKGRLDYCLGFYACLLTFMACTINAKPIGSKNSLVVLSLESMNQRSGFWNQFFQSCVINSITVNLYGF